MGALRGKQLADNSVSSAKLVTTYETGLFYTNGTRPLSGDVDHGGFRVTNLGAPTAATDAARLQDIYNRSQKEVVAAATTANITLSGAQTVDGVSLAAGARVLVKDQSTASGNGIYVVAAGAWTRATDADSATELLGAMVVVTGGTVNADRVYMQTADNITVGTTALTWVQIGAQSTQAVPVTANKNMTASVTSTLLGGELACSTALASTPLLGGWVDVYVNGVLYNLGNGAKTSDFYFSADNGTTARSYSAVASGDKLYTGSALTFTLDATDVISFDYNS